MELLKPFCKASFYQHLYTVRWGMKEGNGATTQDVLTVDILSVLYKGECIEFNGWVNKFSAHLLQLSCFRGDRSSYRILRMITRQVHPLFGNRSLEHCLKLGSGKVADRPLGTSVFNCYSVV
jgi:hypothetical protein